MCSFLLCAAGCPFVVRSGLPSQAFALMQTCLRAAPSVTACAVPPSSGRKALVFRTVQLVSPSGRDVAQRQRGLAPSLRELDCRLAARLREQLIICHASGKLLRRLARVLLLPSRLAPCHLPQGGRLWFSAQGKLVSPSGRDVAQRQRGLAFTFSSTPPPLTWSPADSQASATD